MSRGVIARFFRLIIGGRSSRSAGESVNSGSFRRSVGAARRASLWLITSEAPNALSRSAFSAVEFVAITRAPSTLANCSARTETPPEPSVKTVSPAVIRRWPVNATQAFTAARGNVAASSKERWLGEGLLTQDRVFGEHAVEIGTEPVW